MPIKFSDLDTKPISESSKIVGLYSSESSDTQFSNCLINVGDFAKTSSLNAVDSSAVHIYETERIYGDKTFEGELKVTNTALFSRLVTMENGLKVTGYIDGKSLYDGNGNNIVNTYATKTELEQKSTFCLFHNDWFEYELDDPSWLRADTFSWQDGTVYSNAYNHLVADINGKTLITEKKYVSSNVTGYGSVVYPDGILSGFVDKAGYATHPASTPTTSFEYVIKCRHDEWSGAGSSILESPITGKGGIILRIVDANGTVRIWLGKSNGWVVGNTNVGFSMPKQTWIWFKLAWNGETFTLSTSVDGTTYEQKYSVATTLPPDWSSYGYNCLGGCSWEAYPFSHGCIDLKECYLKIDGSTIWQGCQYQNLNYYVATDGHKIALANSESTINTIYEYGKYTDYYVLDTTNKKFKLPRIKNRTVIESVDNGNSWYRIYADGWVEQGGKLSISDSNGWKKISVFFSKKMADTNYTVSWLNGYTSYTDNSTVISSKTTESFTIPQATTYQTNASWKICGYADKSVLPKVTKYNYYYVGQYTTSAIAQTAGLNTELLNNKMERDMSNMSLDVDFVVDWKAPTDGDPTWYRKYKSGWVEQGGLSATGTIRPVMLVLPVKMANGNYTITHADTRSGTAYSNMYTTWFYNKTESSFTYYFNGGGSGAISDYILSWEVKGMGAQEP